MTSTFAMMASMLAVMKATPAPCPVERQACIYRCNGKTQALRMALDGGAFTAKQLADIASLPNSGLVYALLKADINKGLVELVDGFYRRVQS